MQNTGKKLLIVCLLAASFPSMVLAGNHPWAITKDSLILYTGKTFRYTVDTPEDGGLVSTLPTVSELTSRLNTDGIYRLTDAKGTPRNEGYPQPGDRLELLRPEGQVKQIRHVGIRQAALPATLKLPRGQVTVGVSRNLTLDFFAGQRTPMATVEITVPKGLEVTLDNTTVNVIGRGEVILRDLHTQSIGRTGTHYSYNQVGNVTLRNERNGQTVIAFSGLDFRPANGPDLRLCFHGASLPTPGSYRFEAVYTTSQPEVLKSPVVVAEVTAVTTVTDFERTTFREFTYKDNRDFTFTTIDWTPAKNAASIQLLASVDEGKTWKEWPVTIAPDDSQVIVNRLDPHTLYGFKLRVKGGAHRGESNITWYYSGRKNIKELGVKGDGTTDDTQAVNAAIARVNRMGGGELLFPEGTYNVRTVHLQSNVWLYIDRDATIQALPGGDAPETTWFSDRAYRSGLSPTDPKPYEDPENYLTKQDVGHTFFRNCLFFGERIDNVKIVGTGRITGNGNLYTSDAVMKNEPEKRCDKMFSLKLCTNIEIGGLDVKKDMWYDPQKDIPYYIEGEGTRNYETGNMLHIDQGGHFVLLATGTDGIHVHDTYFGKYNTRNVRDIYDFMACNDVTVTNIYSVVSSDDIVKPGSDCSLGFTRPVRNYRVRNIVGDTNCNLFQIGSETADDIQDLYIDNIYVLGANKAGFSISTNDGGHIKNVYLNSGKTGTLHSRSVMHRTRAPFFISISNRGRVLGADVEMFTFTENGSERKELLVTNSNIGKVENIYINHIDITEVYAGSSFRGERWKAYDGSQNEATPIIAGFKLPDPDTVLGGLTFRLPNGLHTGYIRNVEFTDVNLLVKGRHPSADANAYPPEIGVGRYNVGDLKTQPSFGFWARHVEGFVLKDCTIDAEKPDGRYAVMLDDVLNAQIIHLRVGKGSTDQEWVKSERSRNIVINPEQTNKSKQ